MKTVAALLLLATLVSCAAPAPEPADTALVADPAVVCRFGHEGSPVVADRGIGGTGAPDRAKVVDRGIGGTGIVGVVTGFASVCVDGLEVRLDKSVPVSINGTAATAGQLRVGQLVVMDARLPATATDPAAQARTVAVRYEVSGPIEAIDVHADILTIAGQKVMILPSTWVAGRFALGAWTAVSGLREPGGTIVASRLDRARSGALVVRGRIVRDHDITRVGGLILRGPAVGVVKAGTFVSLTGTYGDKIADVMAIAADPLLEDPVGYFGRSSNQVVLQAFVRTGQGSVSLATGQTFRAEPAVQGIGTRYRDAVIRMKRTADGTFVVTELRYTSYRPQPRKLLSTLGGHGTTQPVLPPYLPPWPPVGVPAGGSTDLDPDTGGPASSDDTTGIVAPSAPADMPVPNAVPSPTADGALMSDRRPLRTPRQIATAQIVAAGE
jgi:hypothetical protein